MGWAGINGSYDCKSSVETSLNFCNLVLECWRKENGPRQPGQRRDHHNHLWRYWFHGNVHLFDFNIQSNTVVKHFCIADQQEPFSDMRDDYSLFSKLFGGVKWCVDWGFFFLFIWVCLKFMSVIHWPKLQFSGGLVFPFHRVALD